MQTFERKYLQTKGILSPRIVSFIHSIISFRIHPCTQIENGPQNEYHYFALESPCGMSSPNLFNFQHTRVCTLASSTCTTCLYFPFSIIQVYFVVNNRRKVILLNSDMFLDRPKVTKLCLNIQNFV